MINLFKKLFGNLELHFNMFNKKQSTDNSPNSTQVQGNYNRVNSPDVFFQHAQNIPEITVSFYGSGGTETIKGDIKNNSSQLLVLEYVDINDIRTEFNQPLSALRGLIFVNDRDNKILFPPNIFTSEIKEIFLIARYRTISGEIYDYKQLGTQTHRADGKYNISFDSASTQIRKIE